MEIFENQRTNAFLKKFPKQNIKNRNFDYGRLGLSLQIKGSIPNLKHKGKHVSKSKPIYAYYFSIYPCILFFLWHMHMPQEELTRIDLTLSKVYLNIHKKDEKIMYKKGAKMWGS